MRFVQAVRRALASLPPLVRRVILRVHLLWLAAAIVLALVTVLHEIQTGPPSYAQLFHAIPLGGRGLSGATTVAIFLVTGLMMLMRPFNPRKAIERDLARTHAVCGRCGYALTGLDRITVCPECGEAYDQERLRRYWRWLNDTVVVRSRRETPSRSEGLFLLTWVWGMALLYALSGAMVWLQWTFETGIMIRAMQATLFWLVVAGMLDRYVFWFLLYTRTGTTTGHADGAEPLDSQQPDEPSAGLHWMNDVILPSRRAWDALQRERKRQPRFPECSDTVEGRSHTLRSP